MPIHQVQYQQLIKTDLATLWNFISSPKNLKEITPKEMNFIITSPFFKEKMYAGMIINYKVSPVLGIKLNWCTEITNVQENEYFVDEQRFGPYALWHHQHHFQETENGILMTDIVNYKLPFGFLGNLFGGSFVKKKLKEIFDFRFQRMEELFNT
ncbi:MAG: SRPBCC family protein [Chitinophagaceae bacterium]|nr:SRPBCC family protein [Chitinophagaceae bacterium]